MKPRSLILRMYGEKQSGQWSLICLDFNLAVQADTLPEAKEKMHSMIKVYLRDALEDGDDSEHANYFLTRRAPVSFWLKYYFLKVIRSIFGKKNGSYMVGSDTIPMLPTGA